MYYRNSVGAIEPNIINMLTDYPEKVNKCSFYTYIFFLVVMVFINNIYVLNLKENIEPKINNSILLFVILYFV